MIRSRNFLFASLFWTAALALAGCGGSIPPQQNYATLQGFITDRATNAPIAGATVSIDSVLTASTGTDGSYRVVNVPPGPYDYSVSADGYTLATGSGTASTTAPATLSVQLDKS